ncbi:hypothetical protein JK358_04490 [Nocardia sp. 2]|uniref:SnoaL-like domain-containing protein n=1 Tax=Nocardia acididurans TaxID=2802282 RepID=A0ABS1M1F3_9NOCA|nr:hypothetical protein [Nocardia acididurans]MBL1073644.1 hypothetical protein [Nocardia acididurans]
MIDYNGRRFHNPDAADGVIARYHQRDDLVWGYFSGGAVRRGSVTGLCGPDAALRLVYTMVLADGTLVAGRTHSTVEYTSDGRLRLREEWERFGASATTGISYLEEIR